MWTQVKPYPAVLLTVFSLWTVAQDHHPSATIGFTLDFPGANPGHYQISVGDNGQGSYSSDGQLDQQSEPADPAPLPFTLSEEVRSQIFDLAQRAHYFTGKVDSGRKNIAIPRPLTITHQSHLSSSSLLFSRGSRPRSNSAAGSGTFISMRSWRWK